MSYSFIDKSDEKFKKWHDFDDALVSDILRRFNTFSITTAVIMSRDGRLAGVITEGDIRRGFLRGLAADDTIECLINRSPVITSIKPIPKTDETTLIGRRIDLVPMIVEDEFVGILVNTVYAEKVDADFVIMAGGKGTRLKPLTEDCPKPMLEIAGKPMIEHIILRAKSHGFTNFTITVNYLGNLIVDHIKDGSWLGVKVTYVEENEPLGTAGALALLKNPPEKPFLVSNGDVVTQLNYREFYDAHISDDSVASMAVRRYEIKNQFGVVHTEGSSIIAFEEKPVYTSQINAGVYVLNPEALEFINKGSHCDMPDLFMKLKAANLHLSAFAVFEPWLDVGNPSDLRHARQNLSV